MARTKRYSGPQSMLNRIKVNFRQYYADTNEKKSAQRTYDHENIQEKAVKTT